MRCGPRVRVQRAGAKSGWGGLGGKWWGLGVERRACPAHVNTSPLPPTPATHHSATAPARCTLTRGARHTVRVHPIVSNRSRFREASGQRRSGGQAEPACSGKVSASCRLWATRSSKRVSGAPFPCRHAPKYSEQVPDTAGAQGRCAHCALAQQFGVRRPNPTLTHVRCHSVFRCENGSMRSRASDFSGAYVALQRPQRCTE